MNEAIIPIRTLLEKHDQEVMAFTMKKHEKIHGENALHMTLRHEKIETLETEHLERILKKAEKCIEEIDAVSRYFSISKMYESRTQHEESGYITD